MEQLIEKKPIHLNITVLGKGMVGKSSLTYRFINYETPQDHDPTIEDKYKVVQEIAGHSVEIGNQTLYFQKYLIQLAKTTIKQ